MICNLLISGTTPTTVSSTIQIIYETLYKEKPEQLPSVNFVRECRVVIEVIGETMAAIKLALEAELGQLWTDGTTWCQRPSTALIVGILSESGVLDPVVISSFIFMDDETSEMQADGILNKVSTHAV